MIESLLQVPEVGGVPVFWRVRKDTGKDIDRRSETSIMTSREVMFHETSVPMTTTNEQSGTDMGMERPTKHSTIGRDYVDWQRNRMNDENCEVADPLQFQRAYEDFVRYSQRGLFKDPSKSMAVFGNVSEDTRNVAGHQGLHCNGLHCGCSFQPTRKTTVPVTKNRTNNTFRSPTEHSLEAVKHMDRKKDHQMRFSAGSWAQPDIENKWNPSEAGDRQVADYLQLQRSYVDFMRNHQEQLLLVPSNSKAGLGKITEDTRKVARQHDHGHRHKCSVEPNETFLPSMEIRSNRNLKPPAIIRTDAVVHMENWNKDPGMKFNTGHGAQYDIECRRNRREEDRKVADYLRLQRSYVDFARNSQEQFHEDPSKSRAVLGTMTEDTRKLPLHRDNWHEYRSSVEPSGTTVTGMENRSNTNSNSPAKNRPDAIMNMEDWKNLGTRLSNGAQLQNLDLREGEYGQASRSIHSRSSDGSTILRKTIPKSDNGGGERSSDVSTDDRDIVPKANNGGAAARRSKDISTILNKIVTKTNSGGGNSVPINENNHMISRSVEALRSLKRKYTT